MRIRHKGLRALHERDDAARLPAGLAPTASAYPVPLARGDASGQRRRAGLPAASLKGDRAGQWSVRVSGNWRVVFRYEDGEAVDVDLTDYH